MELLIAITGALNIICFYLGARVGQKTSKGEEIKLPEVNPAKKYKEYKENKEEQYEKRKLEIIMQNIERYDGTSMGQQDVPR